MASLVFFIGKARCCAARVLQVPFRPKHGNMPIQPRGGLIESMKVYLGFTVAGNRSSMQAARKILGVLQSMGHQVLTNHLVREDAWDADRMVPPQEIFARDMKWLAQCDIFVAEVSGSSFGLGFETTQVFTGPNINLGHSCAVRRPAPNAWSWKEDCKCYGSFSESDLKTIEETASCVISLHSSF